MSAVNRRTQKTIAITPRRMEIIGLIQEGHNLPTIAAKLGLSFDTVRDHVRMLRKARVIAPANADGERRVLKRSVDTTKSYPMN